jgi:hypothetical protein
MDYSVHFFFDGEELFQAYDAPVPRVGDLVSMEADTFDWLDQEQTTKPLAAILSGDVPYTFVVQRVTHAWNWGHAGKQYLYITVVLAAMRKDGRD